MPEPANIGIDPPLAIVLELTHRCPLRCPYCSNPLELERRGEELDTTTWRRVLEEAAELGVLQVHFSGGEPTARHDLEALVEHAAGLGLYSNLITAGVLLDQARVARLVAAGPDHVQLTPPASDAVNADPTCHLSSHTGIIVDARSAANSVAANSATANGGAATRPPPEMIYRTWPPRGPRKAGTEPAGVSAT